MHPDWKTVEFVKARIGDLELASHLAPGIQEIPLLIKLDSLLNKRRQAIRFRLTSSVISLRAQAWEDWNQTQEGQDAQKLRFGEREKIWRKSTSL